MSLDAGAAVGCVTARVAVGIGTLAVSPGSLVAAVVAFEKSGAGVALVEGRCAVSTVGNRSVLCPVLFFCAWGRKDVRRESMVVAIGGKTYRCAMVHNHVFYVMEENANNGRGNKGEMRKWWDVS